jgi:predicted DNA binding CopG/RHH family protein
MHKTYPTPNGHIPLTNVHDAVTNAKTTRAAEKMKVTTIRIPQNLLDKVDFTLSIHGISFSEWVRACCEGLVQDYEEFSKR